MFTRSRSLKRKVWTYLTLFSCIILICLWLFQVVFLNSYYTWYKQRDMEKVVNKIAQSYHPDTLETMLDTISYDQGVCIEIITNGETSYGSDRFNKGCMLLNPRKDKPVLDQIDTQNKQLEELKESKKETDNDMIVFQNEFMDSKKKKDHIILTNPRFHNQMLVYGLKLDQDVYAFVSASLQPLDATTKILTSQFIYVSIGVLLLSFIIGYLISKKISKPVIQLNDEATKMAKGNYDIHFETNSEIKEIDELAHTLNHAKDELAVTDELRRELLANVSHDLKTPLTMIKAYAEMVRDLTYQDDKKRTEHLNVIIEESDRLNELVNDILELSKMQSNLTVLHQENFNITELVHTIVSRFQILTELEGYQFVLTAKEDYYVYADIKKIEQVIYNLIGNAINYTGTDKKVVITIKELEEQIRIEIKDTGNGIKEEEIHKIWDKYYKSNKKHKRNAYGTGLGLSIVKQILEYHHALYGVQSELGVGTTFYFELEKKKDE